MQAALLASYAGANSYNRMLVAVQLSLLELSHNHTPPCCWQTSKQRRYLLLLLLCHQLSLVVGQAIREERKGGGVGSWGNEEGEVTWLLSKPRVAKQGQGT